MACETVPVIGTKSGAAGPAGRCFGAGVGATNGPASKGLWISRPAGARAGIGAGAWAWAW